MFGKMIELENNCIYTNKRFRLMFQDEAGFGRINKPKRCWCGDNTVTILLSGFKE